MAFRDLLHEGSRDLDYDVCVVGSGPAGMAVAHSLASRGRRIAVLESGGLGIETDPQTLNEGHRIGFKDSLRLSRPRAFGGATAVWAGYCATMDADDCVVDASAGAPGWPLEHADIAGWYPPALRFLGIEPSLLDRAAGRLDHLVFEDGTLESKPFVQRKTRIGNEARNAIAASSGIDLWLHATAVAAYSEGRSLKRLIARDLGGNELRVQARVFVVAAGGIENPRLLNWWAGQHDAPIDAGAARNIGRWFCIHPHYFQGALLLTDEAARNPLYRRQPLGGEVFSTTAFQIAAPVRREHRLSKVLFRHERERSPGQSRWYDDRRLGLWRSSDRTMFDLMFIQAEMPMRADNRIRLGEQRDRLGMPRVDVRLSLEAGFYRNLQRSLDIYAIELGRHGYGRVRFRSGVFEEHAAGMRTAWGGHHFLCATRMADGSESGVVDRDLRVFGCDNLYVAGASSFASPGAVNPTLTIVALALRLAGHLGDRL